MTVEHENLRMVTPDDLPNQQSRHRGADLAFGGTCKPTSNDQPSSNDFKDLQDTICGRIAMGRGSYYHYQEHESFQRGTQEVSTKSSEERPVDKGGAERIYGKSSQELELVYQNGDQKLVVCYGCFQESCTTCGNSDVITNHEK